MAHRIRPIGRRDSARTLLGQRARRALGYTHGLTIRPEIGETALRVSIWSPRDLQDVYDHVGGGTVTARPVEQTLTDGTTYASIEIALTIQVPGLGVVTAFAEWNPADELYAFALPVIRAASAPAGTR